MGFFTRKTKTVASSTTVQALSPPPAVSTYQSVPAWPPPPPPQQHPFGNTVNLQPVSQSAIQANSYDNDFLSVEDFNAIQRALNQDTVIDQFDAIITEIDADRWNENDEDSYLIIQEEDEVHQVETTRALVPNGTRSLARTTPRTKQKKVTIYSKVSLYANSRVSDNLPPLRLYINTWPLICLAAQFSRNVYLSPQNSHEKEVFVSADSRLGTKAMVMKSVPCDDKKTLVFAIRGTTLSIRDWCINLDTALVSPSGFLEDDGNLCHSGFLKVAKNMIRPIAMRLRTLLQENPNRAQCSLLITGHSAGGAIAALIFCHMLSTTKSELSNLVNCFKRVHCVTFGSPPVSLLPLTKPDTPRYNKYQFMSFVNEGDPVARAEKAYMRSLVDLLSSAPPNLRAARRQQALKSPYANLKQSISKLDLSLSKLDLTTTATKPHRRPRPSQSQQQLSSQHLSQPQITFNSNTSTYHSRSHPIWPVPMATLSNAGRLVIMRVPPPPGHGHNPRKASSSNLQRSSSILWEKDNLSRVTAHKVTDDQLRGVVFGDPAMHAMEVYLRRVDMLALKAVTART